MFKPEERHRLVQRLAHPSVAAALQKEDDKPYARLAKQIGLDPDGNPPAGTEFVSRTLPAGTTVTKYNDSTAAVTVWCSGVLDLAGPGQAAAATEPFESWFTMQIDLRWHKGEWKLVKTDQTTGPTPDEAELGDYGQAPPL
ncbi:hypothetical protein [Streptomyces sp. NPDC102282]|uniref:hypothetical protein n=1 Tax=Streptomyces sp. NPDC102282 TaxID=3366154 RepID=UPI0037F5FDD0